ncbi:MAG: T9SS type A sorting domain-containing protein [Bacteroidia bacterium]
MYPNPNTGSFTVAFGNPLNDATINVTDMLGKSVYSTTVSGDKHNIQLNQAKGIYFVNIQTEQGESTTLKLVVE